MLRAKASPLAVLSARAYKTWLVFGRRAALGVPRAGHNELAHQKQDDVSHEGPQVLRTGFVRVCVCMLCVFNVFFQGSLFWFGLLGYFLVVNVTCGKLVSYAPNLGISPNVNSTNWVGVEGPQLATRFTCKNHPQKWVVKRNPHLGWSQTGTAGAAFCLVWSQQDYTWLFSLFDGCCLCTGRFTGDQFWLYLGYRDTRRATESQTVTKSEPRVRLSPLQ